jgi:hypothetical protein
MDSWSFLFPLIRFVEIAGPEEAKNLAGEKFYA